MVITAKLHGRLTRYLPKGSKAGEIKQSFQEGLTVRDLLKALSIPSEEKIMVILVNSEDITEWDRGTDDELHDGDTVELFSPIIGG